MAKIIRKQMKMFGSAAGTNELAQFGSLAAASPVYVNDGDPDTIQALAAWAGGWYDAVIGGNSPAIQDMNALLYVFAYQLAYQFQAGVSEWNSATTYYIGSLVNDGTGKLFVSLTNNNTGNAIIDTTNWFCVTSTPPVTVTIAASPVTVSNSGALYNVDTTLGAVSFQLPSGIASGFYFSVKDVGGNLANINATIVRAASEQIENVASNFLLSASYGKWTFTFDGTNWFVS